MIEKTDWEIVDASHAENRNAGDSRQSLLQLMQNLLGPWWRWKVAGATALAIATLVFFATVIGVIILIGTATALLGIGAGKLRQWWLQRGPGSMLAPRNDRS